MIPKVKLWNVSVLADNSNETVARVQIHAPTKVLAILNARHTFPMICQYGTRLRANIARA